MLKAVIWDMDGVLIDTEPIFDQLWLEAIKKCGHEPTEAFLGTLRGTTSRLSWEMIKKEYNLEETVELLLEKYRRDALEFWKSRTHVEPNAGVRGLIAVIRDQKIAQAVASSGTLQRITLLLKRAGLFEEFDVIIHGDSVTDGKPAPDIYLLAAECLNVASQECVAIEDATNGVTSAKAAGMKVVGYQPAHNTQDLQKADLIVGDLRELSVERLKSI